MTDEENSGDDLRGVTLLTVDAVVAVTEVIEAMHRTIAAGPAILGRPLERPAGLATGLVYGSIRGVTRVVGLGLDQALARLVKLLGRNARGPERDALVAALNGVLGDTLERTKNPLATTLSLRVGGETLSLTPEGLDQGLPEASDKLLVLVHGSCMSDLQWTRKAHDHGRALADHGFTPIYVRYNSGLHVSDNGRRLSDLLEQLVEHWPGPLNSCTLLGFSMGGLVARSACHAAEADSRKWRQKLNQLVCVGTPHHGAPLERSGNWVQVLLGISRYSAPLARLGTLRSAGVTDLRFGNVLEEQWRGRDRFQDHWDQRTPLPLPRDVDCFAIAASLSPAETSKPRSDGLVPVNSALGIHSRAELCLAFPREHQWVGYGLGHLDLLHDEGVYQTLRTWLG